MKTLLVDLDGLFSTTVFAETREKESTRAMRRACMNESWRPSGGGHTSCFNRNREEADRRRARKEERTPRPTDRVGTKGAGAGAGQGRQEGAESEVRQVA